MARRMTARARAAAVAQLELQLLHSAQLVRQLLADDLERLAAGQEAPEAKGLSLMAHRVQLAYTAAQGLHR